MGIRQRSGKFILNLPAEEISITESRRDVEIWLRSVGGTPRGIEAGFRRAFDAEKVDAPDGRRIEVERQAAQWTASSAVQTLDPSSM